MSPTNTTDWAIEAANRLETLASLPPGWDSYGGLALKPRAKKFAADVLGWLEQQELPTPSVVLGSGGTVQLEWRSGEKELILDLGEGDAIEYVKVDSHGNTEEDRLTSSFPDEVRALAAWFARG